MIQDLLESIVDAMKLQTQEQIKTEDKGQGCVYLVRMSLIKQIEPVDYRQIDAMN